MPNYKLTYFDIRGKAEACRLLFAFAGVEYEDIRVTPEEFKNLQPSTPFGQLPMMEIDGKPFAQSRALMQHLAREFGVYGKNNMEILQIDQVICIVDDFFTAAVKTFFCKEEEKEEKMKHFTENDIPKYLAMLEKVLEWNAASGFFVGDSLTVADIMSFDFVTEVDRKHSGYVDKYPKVSAHLKKVAEIESIKNWLSKRPVTEH